MAKLKYNIPEPLPKLLEEKKSLYGLRTYISLFSSAGVGCYGFKQENYHCIATVELLERRLRIQQYNHKCIYDSGYICGDMTVQETKDKVFEQLDMWKRHYNIQEPDVIIATPPCQGMSVANHKKGDELKRNSLVVESIVMIQKIKPKFFIFENVRAFLNSICTDVDGKDKAIRQAIESDLSGEYNILYRVINFKDYGNPSSRTRTLVLGVRKDIKDITPLDIFPDKQPERTLRQVIGHLPSLKEMGESAPNDIYHNFRSYSPQMESWIADIKEGQSAFDNTDPAKIPHRIKDGKIVYNAQKNGDKYTRQCWDKVAPCIHTRNDIMASQNTVHPTDNRVFSIREVMMMMSVPDSFQWSDIPFDELNKLDSKGRKAFLKKEEMNIRQNLGEAVPTVIFRQIAKKIRQARAKNEYTDMEIEQIITCNGLTDSQNLVSFISSRKHLGFPFLSKVAELANSHREDNAAYYTRQDICYAIIKNLPGFEGTTELNILEPSIGVGNFLPVLIQKYRSIDIVNIDVVDIDSSSIDILKALVLTMDVPENIRVNYIVDDFLLHNFEKHYDVVIGNPPYKKITKEKSLLSKYKLDLFNQDTNNIFSFFIEKSLKLGNVVSLIVPKSLINAPEFNKTRELLNNYEISNIIDFGEKGFKGVKIETVSFIADTRNKPGKTRVESYITNDAEVYEQSYITDSAYPYWLIYRNNSFDSVADKMIFDIFKVYRDRLITKAITKPNGKFRVLKSRNIGNNEIVNIDGYDSYIDDINSLDVSRFLNQENCVLVPNLTYNPRACMLPTGCIADGSVAILTLKNTNTKVSTEDLAFYATSQFNEFYAIARNRGTRSLNIDNNSVFFFGKLKHA
mgnify:FL=1